MEPVKESQYISGGSGCSLTLMSRWQTQIVAFNTRAGYNIESVIKHHTHQTQNGSSKAAFRFPDSTTETPRVFNFAFEQPGKPIAKSTFLSSIHPFFIIVVYVIKSICTITDKYLQPFSQTEPVMRPNTVFSHGTLKFKIKGKQDS